MQRKSWDPFIQPHLCRQSFELPRMICGGTQKLLQVAIASPPSNQDAGCAESISHFEQPAFTVVNSPLGKGDNEKSCIFVQPCSRQQSHRQPFERPASGMAETISSNQQSSPASCKMHQSWPFVQPCISKRRRSSFEQTASRMRRIFRATSIEQSSPV